MIDLICSSPLDDDSMHKYPLDILSEAIHEVRSLAIQLCLLIHAIYYLYYHLFSLYIYL